MEITRENLNFLFDRFSADYLTGVQSYTALWPQIATRVPSTTRMQTYGFLADAGGYREWIGPRIFKNIAARAHQIINKDWENSFALSRNTILDDEFALFANRAAIMGLDGAGLWDDLIFDALQKGTTTLCIDGQFFFDTDHPNDNDDSGAGVYSNLFTNTPLTAENVSTLKATMAGYKTESGRAGRNRATILLAPPALEWDAIQATAGLYVRNVRNVAGTEIVGGVALPIPNAGDVTPVISTKLTDPKAWYLLSTDRIKPFVLQVRQEPNFVQRIAPTDDNVFYRKEFEFGSDARGAAGYTLPQLAVKAVAP